MKKIILVIIMVVIIAIIFIYRTYSLYKTHFEKGNELAQLGKYEQAISEFEKSLKYGSPNDINTHHNIAKARIKLKQYNEAITVYKKILAINSNDAKSYKMLAATYGLDAASKKDVEELREALRCIKKAFELTPSQMDENDKNLLKNLKQLLGE